MITILEVNRYANQFVEVGWSFLNSEKIPHCIYCICILRTSDRLESDTFMLSSLLYIVLTVDYNFQRPVDIFLISWFLGTIVQNMWLATIPKLCLNHHCLRHHI